MPILKDYCIGERETIVEAISAITKNLSRCVVVCGDSGKVIGIVSEGDILRYIIQGVDLYAPVYKLVSPSFHFLNTRDMEKAYELVRKHGITLIPIVDENFYLCDTVTIFDVLEYARSSEADGLDM
ncbi:MAG: CBS domain-containing protein [Sedimentisphaerales bacterium]|nr:CBS domain-containing protein [Sedimentisphaerales bacterium]